MVYVLKANKIVCIVRKYSILKREEKQNSYFFIHFFNHLLKIIGARGRGLRLIFTLINCQCRLGYWLKITCHRDICKFPFGSWLLADLEEADLEAKWWLPIWRGCRSSREIKSGTPMTSIWLFQSLQLNISSRSRFTFRWSERKFCQKVNILVNLLHGTLFFFAHSGLRGFLCSVCIFPLFVKCLHAVLFASETNKKKQQKL